MSESRFPWPVVGLSLTAFVSLAIAMSGGAVLAPLAALLVAHRFAGARLPDRPWVTWVVRVAVFGAVAAWLLVVSSQERYVRMYGSVIKTIALLSAAEIVIQSWRRSPSGGPGGLVAILLSGLVLLAGVNVDNEIWWPTVLVPVYFVFLIPSLRAQRARTGAGGRGRQVAAGLATVALGLLLATALRTWRESIVRVDNVLNDWFRSTGVGEGARCRLGDGPGDSAGLDRVLAVAGPLADPHLRGTAWDEYRDGEWGPAFPSFRTVPDDELRPAAAGTRIAIRRIGSIAPTVYVPLHAAGIAARTPGSLRWDRDRGASLAGERNLDSWEAAQADAADTQGPLCIPPTTEALRQLLDVPPGIDPGVRVLAETIAGRLPDPSARVSAVVQYLQSNHRYSLSIRPGPGDPVSVFLLRKLDAHCEYFASAAVILLRCVGVPARYVNGFYAHEAAGDGATVVRQRDAHAWAEAWIDGAGWVTVEATPSSGRPDQAGAHASWARKAWEQIRDALVAAFHRLRELGWSLIVVVAALAAGIAGLWLGFRRLRALLMSRKTVRSGFRYATDPRFIGLASRFEQALARRDFACPPDRTWAEHLAARADLEAERRFAEAYGALRFGGRGGTGELEEMLAGIEQEGER